MKEVVPNHKYMSANAYAKQMHLAPATVINMCKNGGLSAYQTEGGQWRIKVPDEDVPDKKDYERILKENTELKFVLESMRRMLAGVST